MQTYNKLEDPPPSPNAVQLLIVSAWSHVLTNPALGPTASDLEALRAVTKSPAATVAEQVLAHHARAQILLRQGSAYESARESRRILKIAPGAAPEHRATEHLIARGRQGHADKRVLVGEVIDEIVRESRVNIAPDAQEGGDPSEDRLLVWPVDPRITGAERRAAAVASQNAVRRLIRAAGCSLASCGATSVKLSACAKCGVARYCSQACQRAEWPAHKPQCRSPGTHEPGDIVVLRHLSTRPHLNGAFFRVIGPDPRGQGRWHVWNPGMSGAPQLSVRAACMQHVLTH